MKLTGFIPGDKSPIQEQNRRYIQALAGQRPVKYFVEKGSAERDLADRVELWDAIDHSRETGSTFAIATLTNFTTRRWKSLALLEKIADDGIEIEVADDPSITSGSITVLALSAEVAKEKIVKRSAEAINRIKAKLERGEVHVSASGREIKKLGARSQAELSKQGNDAKVERAREYAESVWPIIEPLIARGMSMNRIAQHLNRVGVKTSKGGRFYQSTIAGIVRRMSDEG